MAYTTIDDPSAYFQTALWSGNDSTQTITNDGNSDMQPDWVWIKRRDGSAINHLLYDSSRGATKNLSSNTTDVEGTRSTGLTGFNSDGFALGAGGGENSSGNTFVGWQWKCNGGTTSTNSDGTVNTTMQLNSTAGFSIITWTGAGNNTSTAGHGLGVIPDCIIVKNREATQNWSVAFPKFETSKLLGLNLDSAFFSASGLSSYNTSTFVDGSGSSSEDYIAYCFKNIQGYSKIGRYEGNGNTDGPFVYTGFKPAWTMIKEAPNTGSWYINDTKRDTYNLVDQTIYADSSVAEATESNNSMDYFSNGFKLRGTGNDTNLDGSTYVYIAFAEHPFVSSEGVPCTAR